MTWNLTAREVAILVLGARLRRPHWPRRASSGQASHSILILPERCLQRASLPHLQPVAARPQPFAFALPHGRLLYWTGRRGLRPQPSCGGLASSIFTPASPRADAPPLLFSSSLLGSDGVVRGQRHLWWPLRLLPPSATSRGWAISCHHTRIHDCVFRAMWPPHPFVPRCRLSLDHYHYYCDDDSTFEQSAVRSSSVPKVSLG